MLKNYVSLLDEASEKLKNQESVLRFNQPAAIASDIAQQYYCEKKVEMAYILGKIETETKRLGTEAHQILLEGSEEIKTEELWEEIFSEKFVSALEWFLVAKYKNIVLAGRPDCIIFHRGLPIIILEYKFSEKFRAFRDHHVQARIYGLLLNRMGFNTEKLLYAIVVINPRVENIGSLKREIERKIVSRIMKNESKEDVLKFKEARVYVNKFELGEAEKDIDWALDFWTERREAIPTRNSNKCKSCEYALKCEAGPRSLEQAG